MSERVWLPALQGQFGEWTYYSAIMRLSEVKKRVGFARELHPNQRLGERIQRELQDSGPGGRDRAAAISEYLHQNSRRFFNAIVVGIYGGEPVWHPFDVKPRAELGELDAGQLAEQERVGFLELQGTEHLFALDGQHRVAGIKRAVNGKGDVGDDILTVLFVPHSNDDNGIARTRRLFVDLNKRVVAVAKKDIIILDEVDLPAILARRLVDEHEWFSTGQIDVDRFSNHVPRDSKALCSIATLYDVIKRVLPTALAHGPEEKEELKRAVVVRLEEDRINHYYGRAVTYFEGLGEANPQLKEYLQRGPESGIALVARGADVRNVLFRPVGQQAYAIALAALAQREGLESALETARSFPVDMAEPPFAHVVWEPGASKMTGKGAGLAGRLLKYMCGLERASEREKLQLYYQTALGDRSAELPDRIGRS